MRKYTKTKHSTTGMPPSIAGKPENRVQVYLNIKAKAQFKRRYPDIEINSKVRVYVKPKTFKKGWHSSWSENVYNVENISDDKNSFLLTITPNVHIQDMNYY